MNTAEVWAGTWGQEYTARNRADWRARIPFWREVLDLTGARSVYEVGCNAGWNLSAIKAASNGLVEGYGHDVNYDAVLQARSAGLDVTHAERWPEDAFLYRVDLSFTAGVLIHIAPKELPSMMRQIVGTSADYVLAVEYAADKEEEVLYRGQSGMLWRRPYGQLYQDMGLQLVKEWDAGPGFDRCTAYLLRHRP